MEPIIIEPLSTGFTTVSFVYSIVAIIGLGLMILSFIKNWKVLSLLGFIAMIISGGSVFMNYMAGEKLVPVTIYQDSLETLYGKNGFNELAKSSIERNVDNEVNAPIQMTSNHHKYLIIELINGERILLSENNYPIEEVKTKLDEQVEKWAKNR